MTMSWSCENLEGNNSRQKEQQVQEPCGETELGITKKTGSRKETSNKDLEIRDVHPGPTADLLCHLVKCRWPLRPYQPLTDFNSLT